MFRGHVLLVEDGEDNRRLITRVLERAGLEVAVAVHGQEALDLLIGDRRRSFDLVLMDMMMPVLDGFAATVCLREAGYSGAVVALTAHALDTERNRCMECGCDDFITKPLQRGQFFRVLQRWLQPAHLEVQVAGGA